MPDVVSKIPCPFCAGQKDPVTTGDKLYFKKVIVGVNDVVDCVACAECGAQGPYSYEGDFKAKCLWERRSHVA